MCSVSSPYWPSILIPLSPGAGATPPLRKAEGYVKPAARPAAASLPTYPARPDDRASCLLASSSVQALHHSPLRKASSHLSLPLMGRVHGDGRQPPPCSIHHAHHRPPAPGGQAPMDGWMAARARTLKPPPIGSVQPAPLPRLGLVRARAHLPAIKRSRRYALLLDPPPVTRPD